MSWLAGIVIATMLATAAFMVVRITLFLLTEGPWYDRIAAAALLFAECFYFINCLGYFGNVFRVLTRPRGDVALPDDLPELQEYPKIAIAVASYREPLEVVEKNLIVSAISPTQTSRSTCWMTRVMTSKERMPRSSSSTALPSTSFAARLA
jgi:hypothetical protein